MERLSFSALADFWACPRLYHYRHELELPVPARDRSARREGTQLHEQLHLHALGHTPPLAHSTEPEQAARWQAYLQAIAPYQGWESHSEWACLVPLKLSGLNTQASEPAPEPAKTLWLYGRIDRLYVKADRLVLLDFKTGKGTPLKLLELQLDFYAWLLWQAQSQLAPHQQTPSAQPFTQIQAQAICLTEELSGPICERTLTAEKLPELSSRFESLLTSLLSPGPHDVPEPRSVNGKPWCTMCEYQRLCPEGSYHAE